MYWLWELSHAALNPARAVADATRLYYKNPINPLAATSNGKRRRPLPDAAGMKSRMAVAVELLAVIPLFRSTMR